MNDNCDCSTNIIYRIYIYINKTFANQKLSKQTTAFTVGEEGGNSRMEMDNTEE